MYPRFMYHKELCPDGKVVKSEQEHRELGKGWTHSPSFEPGPGDELAEAPKKNAAPVGATSDQAEPSAENSEAPAETPAEEKKSRRRK